MVDLRVLVSSSAFPPKLMYTMALSTGGSAASRGTSLGAEVRHAPPVMDYYRGVVYNALVAQGPIERRRRARAQQGHASANEHVVPNQNRALWALCERRAARLRPPRPRAVSACHN